MIKEAIILAGGFGTRLQSVVSELPKPMAPVAGKPFLEYILDDLSEQGMTTCILAVGHLRHTIIDYFGSSYKGMTILYSEEPEPLGTGGGMLQASRMMAGNAGFVINGDTFFSVDLAALYETHVQRNATLSLALKPMQQFDRYGTVEVNSEGCVIGFQEKKFQEEGLINGGVYCINKDVFGTDLPEKFSFEKEILEVQFAGNKVFGMVSDTYFIDIGIPEDYAKAQLDFAAPLPEISTNWTLFLDRDGVINQKIDNDYVRRPEDFHFLPGVLEAFPILSAKFGRIVIVTNQRGIGRGLFTEADLQQIHAKLLEDVVKAGGRIDGIYFCPHLADDDLCNCRKPKPGLAFQAMQTFPEIDLQKSILAGDSPSDIAFGAGLGMFTIQISNHNHAGADLHYPNLHDFAVDIG